MACNRNGAELFINRNVQEHNKIRDKKNEMLKLKLIHTENDIDIDDDEHVPLTQNIHHNHVLLVHKIRL